MGKCMHIWRQGLAWAREPHWEKLFCKGIRKDQSSCAPWVHVSHRNRGQKEKPRMVQAQEELRRSVFAHTIIAEINYGESNKYSEYSLEKGENNLQRKKFISECRAANAEDGAEQARHPSHPPSAKITQSLLVSSAFNRVLNITQSNFCVSSSSGRTYSLRTQHFTKPTLWKTRAPQIRFKGKETFKMLRCPFSESRRLRDRCSHRDSKLTSKGKKISWNDSSSCSIRL